MIKHDPEIKVLYLIKLSQNLEQTKESGTRKWPASWRGMHTLQIENHCFSLKQRIIVRYFTDTPNALICAHPDFRKCKCGEQEITLSFPAGQAYFHGSKKTFVKFVCWKPTVDGPDFNFQIEVESLAFSSGSSSDVLGSVNGTAILNTYVSEGGSQND
jgi:hypothetical protein